MQKQILYGQSARDVIYSGVKKVSDAVCVTLGPLGRNVIISRCAPSQNGLQYWMPFATKDGVSVARNITLDNQLENTGANIIKQASEKTMLDAGDGTTTTCLLMKSILEKGIEEINKGVNPQKIKSDIDEAVSLVVSKLKALSIPVDGDIEKIRQVATVSANNDKAIGDLIAEAFEKIGMDGVIDIEEAKGTKTEIKISDGIKIQRGWESQYFINNQAKMECVLENPYILLYDSKITKFDQFGKLLELLVQQRHQLLIICGECDGEALAGLAMNARDKVFVSCVIRCPEFGDLKQQSMEDLAVITGGTYISPEKGLSLDKVKLDDLGVAKKVVVSKNETIIVSPDGDRNEIIKLINDLKMDLVGKEGEEKEQIEKRIAKLIGGIAVISVGAPTEIEMKEKKDRVDDAVRATKAAISEGILPGGGSAFLKIKTGDEIMDAVLREPMKQICLNAGVNYEELIQEVSNSEQNIGYNAKDDKVENILEAGIIDPVKVLRCSLENAASAATMILTSESLICDTL